MAKILMIDDDTDFVTGMRILLESRKHEFFAAFNGEEGLARVKDVNPDLILLDVMMDTRTEGFHVSLRLRDRYCPGEAARIEGVKNCVGDFPAPPSDRRPA